MLGSQQITRVPLAEAVEVENDIQVPHPRMLVKDAPSIEAEGHLSEAEEAELYRHYGLDYETVTDADSDRAASQPGEPAADDQPSAPSGANQPTGTPMRAQEEGRVDDGEPPGSDGPGSSWPAGQERFEVGEGVSRPFVYETPASSQDRPASRRRQPGQVRLRRYLVTEVVTETEAGQRHEVRVQSEPVSDAEVDAVRTAPDRQGEPIGQEPNGPGHNDWFSDENDPRH